MRRILSIIYKVYKNFKFTLFEKLRRELFPPKLPKNKDGKVYIHLGCGEINVNGFINLDIRPYSHVHYISPVEDLNIFPNEYADLIYASHVIEHISHNDVQKVLREWFRVLKKGGILRISVPDFDKVINIYLAEGRNIMSIVGPLMGGQNHIYNFHKAVFNEGYLREILLLAGFQEVRVWKPEEVEIYSFEDWANRPIKVGQKKYTISLNIEAVK